MGGIDEAVLQNLYLWVDRIPLSRVKRNISRDFSDGVLMAEVMKHFFPKYVNLHNFPTCNSGDAKRKNWQLLNWKVFKKLNFELSDDVIDSIIRSLPGTIEKVLLLLKSKIERLGPDGTGRPHDCRPESDRFHDPSIANSKPISPRFKPRSFKLNRSLSPLPLAPANGFRNENQSSGVKQDFLEGKLTNLKYESSEFVPRVFYEDKVQICLSLEETVEIQNAKIRRLEHLIRLKDCRIDELQKSLGRFH